MVTPPTETKLTSMKQTRMQSKFGPFGGAFVPEVLVPALEELERVYIEARARPGLSS